jgi:hypothetical protein
MKSGSMFSLFLLARGGILSLLHAAARLWRKAPTFVTYPYSFVT